MVLDCFGIICNNSIRRGNRRRQLTREKKGEKRIMSGLVYFHEQKTLNDILNLYENGQLNLNPGFQRQSVWSENDRKKLIDSLFRGFPLPSIFLYKRHEGGDLIYDVIDGKQRIETFLMFTGKIRGGRFKARVQLPKSEQLEWVDWNLLKRNESQHLVLGYRLQVVQVEGDLSDIIDVFVRINSTGKALTPQERRKAKFYNSPFLKKAAQVARKYSTFLRSHKIISATQEARMKHVELISELMVSAHAGDVINKKAALDKVMDSNSLTPNQVAKATEVTVKALKRTASIFPNLKQTRFHNISDFYSLVVLVMKFETERKILTNRKRNSLANDLLTAFATGVDQVREKQKLIRGTKPSEELFRDYMMTVTRGTDEIGNRRRRAEILRGLLGSLFEKKDDKRLFSVEQRRILWNISREKKCSSCGTELMWEDLTIDHIRPHSKGGQTSLNNAALMCRSCNSSKNNRTRRR